MKKDYKTLLIPFQHAQEQENPIYFEFSLLPR